MSEINQPTPTSSEAGGECPDCGNNKRLSDSGKFCTSSWHFSLPTPAPSQGEDMVEVEEHTRNGVVVLRKINGVEVPLEPPTHPEATDWEERIRLRFEAADTAINFLKRDDILEWFMKEFRSLLAAERERLINELENNPNPDGSISPNIQHWIEAKQIQLRQSLTPNQTKEK